MAPLRRPIFCPGKTRPSIYRMPRAKLSDSDLDPTIPITLTGQDVKKTFRTFPSPPLEQLPDTVLLLTNRNYSNIFNKLSDALNGNGIRAIFNHVPSNMSRDEISRTLALFYEPGSVGFYSFGLNIDIPEGMPWGIVRGSSFYRLDNLMMEKEGLYRQQLYRQQGQLYRQQGFRTTFNFSKLKKTNQYFDGLTPLVLCGTEDLLDINPCSVFLGQPQCFNNDFIENKNPDSIGHVSTSRYRDTRKGTNLISSAFRKINFIPANVRGIKKEPFADIMNFMRNTGMMVSTMTSWDSGIGYTTLESAANSCLVMSRNPKQAHYISSKVVDVRTPDDLVDKARFYYDNPDEFQAKRREQYDWFDSHFSYSAITERLLYIIQDVIDSGWEIKKRPRLRRI